MAMTICNQFLAELQKMRAEHRALKGKLREAKRALQDLAGNVTEIPETEVVMLLNNNPWYRELQSRRAALQEVNNRLAAVALPKAKPSPGDVQIKTDCENTRSQLESLEQQARDQVRGGKRIALEGEIRRLESQVQISVEQLAGFEKEVECKANEADNVGRGSVAAQMARAEVENVGRILQRVAEERETLRVELKSPQRVKVLGDPNSPAAVPECPD